MNTLMKITTYNLIYPKKLKFFFTRTRQFVNVYILSHKKSHFFKNKNALQKHDHFQ